MVKGVTSTLPRIIFMYIRACKSHRKVQLVKSQPVTTMSWFTVCRQSYIILKNTGSTDPQSERNFPPTVTQASTGYRIRTFFYNKMIFPLNISNPLIHHMIWLRPEGYRYSHWDGFVDKALLKSFPCEDPPTPCLLGRFPWKQQRSLNHWAIPPDPTKTIFTQSTIVSPNTMKFSYMCMMHFDHICPPPTSSCPLHLKIPVLFPTSFHLFSCLLPPQAQGI